MRNIQVCHDVGTLFIDRDGTTVLLEIRVYHYLAIKRRHKMHVIQNANKWFSFALLALFLLVENWRVL